MTTNATAGPGESRAGRAPRTYLLELIVNQTDPTACPYCQHAAHRPGVECEGGVDHGPGRWHRCLCLNLVDAARACPPQMTCQGGTLGYADVWYRQQGLVQPSSDGETGTGVASVGFPSTGKAEPAAASAVVAPPTDRAGWAEAAVERVRAVLETEAVVGRSALEYRGLIASALMAVEAHDTGTQQQEAVPASRLSGQHADALWDAIAPPGPDRPSYPVQHERVCRVVADIVDEVTAGAGLQQPDTEAPTADRPAVLREIATTLDQLAETDVIRKRRSLATARRLLAVELRRMADDEPAPVAQQPAAEASVESWARALAGARVMGRGGLPFDQLSSEEQEAFREQARQIAEQQAAAADGEETPSRAVLLDLVRDFLDPDPCSFDHHGYCQAHGYLGGEPGSCPHGRARKLIPGIDEDATP